MNIRSLLAMLPALALPFCALAADERVAYTCDNASRIDISFSADSSGRPQATLHFALYRNGDIRLHTKGDDAIIEDGKSNLRRCSRGSVAPVPPAAQSPSNAPQASSSFIDIAGNVRYLARITLPSNAILKIRIQSGQRTLADQRYELNGAQVPIPFSATVDRDLMGKKAGATVSARIEASGKLLFASPKPVPAIRNGQPVPVDIVLKPAGRADAR